MIAIHCGMGAYCINDQMLNIYKEVLQEMCKEAKEKLIAGENSLEIVTYLVSKLEDCEYVNAGKGSSITDKGTVEMEAAVMEGCSKLFGSVSCVKTIKNPVKAAKCLIDEQKSVHDGLIVPQYLTGCGADEFGSKCKLDLVDNSYFITPITMDIFHKIKKDFPFRDTVGVICIDMFNNISAGGSTGGIYYRPQGRVGHLCLPSGAGVYVNNVIGSATCTTGLGELIARENVARRITELYKSVPRKHLAQKIRMEINEMLESHSIHSSWTPSIGGITLNFTLGEPFQLISFLSSDKLMVVSMKMDSTFKLNIVDATKTHGQCLTDEIYV